MAGARPCSRLHDRERRRGIGSELLSGHLPPSAPARPWNPGDRAPHHRRHPSSHMAEIPYSLPWTRPGSSTASFLSPVESFPCIFPWRCYFHVGARAPIHLCPRARHNIPLPHPWRPTLSSLSSPLGAFPWHMLTLPLHS
jgi:hypothetical protein